MYLDVVNNQRATAMNILHIDSSILGTNSITRHLSALTVERLRAIYPGAHVEHRDLGEEPLPHLTGSSMLDARYDGFDHQEPYLRTLFRFLGINDVTFIHAQGVALSSDARPAVVAAAEAEIERLFGMQQLAA